MDVMQRFSRFYVACLRTKCWNWIGAMDGEPRDGGNPRGRYGRFAIDGYSKVGAHRASYLLFKGEIPAGMQVCHSCDNQACVNPDHLWIGTLQQNMDDQVAKGRNAVRNGFRPRKGTGVSHKSESRGQCIYTTCCMCDSDMEQTYSAWKKGGRPCCCYECKCRCISYLRKRYFANRTAT